jgi:hypothetical protein
MDSARVAQGVAEVSPEDDRARVRGGKRSIAAETF